MKHVKEQFIEYLIVDISGLSGGFSRVEVGHTSFCLSLTLVGFSKCLVNPLQNNDTIYSLCLEIYSVFIG